MFDDAVEVVYKDGKFNERNWKWEASSRIHPELGMRQLAELAVFWAIEEHEIVELKTREEKIAYRTAIAGIKPAFAGMPINVGSYLMKPEILAIRKIVDVAAIAIIQEEAMGK